MAKTAKTKPDSSANLGFEAMLRLTAASPDLLAVIKREGKV